MIFKKIVWVSLLLEIFLYLESLIYIVFIFEIISIHIRNQKYLCMARLQALQVGCDETVLQLPGFFETIINYCFPYRPKELHNLLNSEFNDV